MLSVSYIAKDLDLSTRTIYRYIKAGKLKAIKLGAIFRIREEDYKKFLS